jgi:hypothetical protein
MTEPPVTSRLEVGVASHPIAPDLASGDAWCIERVPRGFVVAAVDGLGHGLAAATAAERAVAAIAESKTLTLEEVMRACHRALVSSRGAAISLARIDAADEKLEWLGVGNVEGQVFTPIAYQAPNWRVESLVVRGGVVGYEMPHLQTGHVTFGLGAILVFATDGVKLGFSSAVRPGRPPQETADQIMAGYDRGTDDALVLVVQQMRGGSDREG